MGYALTKQQLNEYLKALGRQYVLVAQEQSHIVMLRQYRSQMI